MVILALDDEKMALSVVEEAIKTAVPDCDLHTFRIVSEAIEFAKTTTVDVAFLDIRMKGHTGIEVALMLKKINPKVNIIFATGFSEFRGEAFDMHASGYLTKPITPEKVKVEMENLRFVKNDEKKDGIFAHTFGNFDLFVNGTLVQFARSLAKEVLAYLIDKHGGSATRQELSLLLFGDEDYSRKTQDYLSKVIKSLVDSLEAVGAEKMLVKQRNAYAVDVDTFKCDAYLYLAGEPSAMNSFDGAYMAQYIWSEDVIDKFYKDFD